MQIIAWKVGRGNPVLMLLGAVMTMLLAHIGCFGPVLLVPLGISGAGSVLGKALEGLQPWLYTMSFSMLVFTGWRIHRNKNSHLIEKVVYWVTVFCILFVIYL